MNATASLVDRSRIDGLSSWFLRISRWRSSRYLPDIVDRSDEKGMRALLTSLNALPLFTHPKGGAGGVFVLLGFHLFLGMVHEGSCAVQRDVGRVMLDQA